MNNNLKISIIQVNTIWNNIPKNLSNLTTYLEKIGNSDLIILPEVFDTGFITNTDIINMLDKQKTIDWLKNKAIEKSVAIAGSSFIKTKNGIKNRFIFSKPDGSYEYYDKRHLFSMIGENKNITKGINPKIVEYNGWRINLQICYDLRFPVWSRNVSNYDLMIYVANWPKSRIEQWKALLIARAIENQAYVVGVNRIGTDENNYEYSGKSLIVNHKGEIILEALENESQVETIELDLNKLKSDRKKFPVLKDRDNFEIID